MHKNRVICAALWDLRNLRANVIHSGNTTGRIEFADICSRMDIDLFKTQAECTKDECAVCLAAGLKMWEKPSASATINQLGTSIRDLCLLNQKLVVSGDINNVVGPERVSLYPTTGFIETIDDSKHDKHEKENVV